MRIYQRKFDWDEARRLHGEGWTCTRIAEHFGVTSNAIYRVVAPGQREKQNAYKAAWQSDNRPWVSTCIDCGLAATAIQGYARRNGRCRACASIFQATTVREDALQCHACHQWKPDDAFTSRPSRLTRRRRDAECKACQAQRKREFRAKRASA